MSGSGDHPSGNRGWNHDWFDSEPIPSPETQFSPPPQTQGSQFPGGYRPYPVDDQDASGYGWASEPPSGGSGSSARTPTSIPTPTPPIRGTRTPYSPDEMMRMFKAYLAVSEDPDVGTNQTGETYWWRITRLYNETRPEGTIPRNESMVRNCIYRCNEAIGKFQGYYLQEERSAGSGTNELDIISAALATYQRLELKPFKYLACWQEGRQHPKYRGGTVASSSGSSSKRSRSVALSDGASDDVATQLAATNLGSPDAGPSSSRRPQGRKKAAANLPRRRAPTPSADPDPDPAPAPFVPPPPPNNTLWALLGQLYMNDTSKLTPEQLATHEQMIRGLKRQLGLED